MRTFFVAAALVFGMFVSVHSAIGDTTLEVTTTNPPPFYAGSFGPWSGQAGQIGQTIIVPATDHVLTSFSFTAAGVQATDGGSFYVQAHVARWDNPATLPTGSLLYSSAEYLMPPQNPTTLTFDTGNLDLTAGGRYVLFLNAKLVSNGNPPNGNSSGFLFAREDDPYPDGRFVYGYMTGPEVTNGSWHAWSDGGSADLGFRATLVPEPSGALVIILVGSAIAARRRN